MDHQAQLKMFWEGMAEISKLDPGKLNTSTRLDSFEYGWDSLTWMSTAVLLEDAFGKRNVDVKMIAACATIGEVLNVAGVQS